MTNHKNWRAATKNKLNYERHTGNTHARNTVLIIHYNHYLQTCGTLKCVFTITILLTKLHLYGIQGITIDWFRSCLTNRKQKVEIKSPNSTHNLVSDWGNIEARSPQGSILGPLLFLVYIDDLSLQINSLAEPISFADDTNFIISNRNFINFSTSANLVLARMTEWFSANMLVLNLQKTNIMKL
jgi:hypothetical protein